MIRARHTLLGALVLIAMAAPTSAPAYAASVDGNDPSVTSPSDLTEQPQSDELFLAEDTGTAATSVMSVQRFTSPADSEPEPLDRESYAAKWVPRVSYPVPPVGISSGFGSRTCPEGPCTTFHEGVDYPSPEGTLIKSVAHGVVLFAGPDGNYGNKVIIRHDLPTGTFTTVYGHLMTGSTRVHAGQTLSRGDILGSVGNTGRSYGAHLHFEVRNARGAALNPLPWFAANDTLPYPS